MRARLWPLIVLLPCSLGQPALAAGPGPAKAPARFNCKIATLTVGRDGLAYLTSLTPTNAGLLLRVRCDGTDPILADATGMPLNATANADGVIATALVHFARNVTLFDRDFRLLGRFVKFSGAGGFSSPAHVEAGPSGDFYAADQYADRIVRFGPDGVRAGTYLIPREPAGPAGEIRDFRVCEKTKELYVLTQGPAGVIRCFSVDAPDWKVAARKLWSVESCVSWGEPHLGGGAGAFDVDNAGVLYVTDRLAQTIRRFGPDGKRLDDLKLHQGQTQSMPQDPGFRTMRVCQGEILLKRTHDAELFQRYDLATGASKGAVSLGECKAPEPRPAQPETERRSARVKGTVRVLFVGNSQVNCIADIPEIVEDLSHLLPADKPRIQADAVVIGGASLERLWKDGLALKKIEGGGFGGVVLQEMIDVAESQGSRFPEYARLFDEAVRKSGARTLLFATGHIQTRRANHALMYRANLDMARQLECRVAGAGMSWLKVWEQRPELDLHHTDRAHPNLRGYYLNACVVFAALTDVSPVGLDLYGLPREEAELFQRIAWSQYAEDRAAERK